jgi:hypothetical protein
MVGEAVHVLVGGFAGRIWPAASQSNSIGCLLPGWASRWRLHTVLKKKHRVRRGRPVEA